VFLPKGASAEVVGRLNTALRKVMDDRRFAQRLEPLGLYVVAPERRTPDYLGHFVAAEIDEWAPAIRASGATGE
jgi:tripartite-type tricarboxylate transporter receptor subunit TctC